MPGVLGKDPLWKDGANLDEGDSQRRGHIPRWKKIPAKLGSPEAGSPYRPASAQASRNKNPRLE